jgi:phosphoglycerate dehydrogenase-like enzyme
LGDRIAVLVGYPDPELYEQVRRVSARIEVVLPEQVQQDPELLHRIEVAFGGIARSDVARARGLRWFQTTGAGVNGLLTPQLVASDLAVTNASGIHAEPITEHMFAMLLMTTRCLVRAWEQQQGRQWRGFDFGEKVDLLAGKTLGVLGVGAIGGHAARVGEAFGMRVIGLRRTGEPHPHVRTMFTPAQRLEFFAECDVVMNSMPLTENTRGFMGEREFDALKPGAIVQNTGRGATINTPAMMLALRRGRLRAALLDVTDPEPLPEDHPLWTMEGVVITPHYSGSHPGYRRRASRIFLDNLQRYLDGRPLLNQVDKGEGY